MRVGLLLSVLALPPLWAACSATITSGGPFTSDAGSAGTSEGNAAPELDSGLKGTDCTLLSVSQCAAGKDCTVLEAQPRAPKCQNDFEAVGCTSIDNGCDDALTRAADPMGRQWLFRSGCIPRGWTPLPSATDQPCGTAGAAN